MKESQLRNGAIQTSSEDSLDRGAILFRQATQDYAATSIECLTNECNALPHFHPLTAMSVHSCPNPHVYPKCSVAPSASKSERGWESPCYSGGAGGAGGAGRGGAGRGGAGGPGGY